MCAPPGVGGGLDAEGGEVGWVLTLALGVGAGMGVTVVWV